MINEFNRYIVPYLQIDKELRNTRLQFLSYKSLLGANEIYRTMAKSGNLRNKRLQIENWDLYEKNEDDLTQDIFFKYFLSDLTLNSEVILITDEGIMNDCGFMFRVDEFYNFSDLYEDHFSMEFFQLSFYLVVSLDQSMVRYIDEDGGVNQYVV